jgi:hypothetical protein
VLKSSCRLAVAAAAILAMLPAAAHAAAAGVNISGGATALPEVAPAASTGASTVRVFLVYQGGSAPDQGTLDAYDGIINNIVAHGAKAVVVVSGVGGPPADIQAYANYIGVLAARYGSKVAAWEAWNEEDEAIWWGTAGGDPIFYAALLKAVYPKVHPHAPLFFGALTGNNFGFLESVYKALGGSSAGAFDGVAVHTDTACSLVPPDSYERTSDGKIGRFSFLGFIEVRKVMVAHGDDGKPIWITEIGWSTNTGICTHGVFAGQKAAGVSEADQARFLALAWHCLQSYPYVTNAMWFSYQDGGEADSYGMVHGDGSPKPSLAAFTSITHGGDPAAGQSCGDFGGPRVVIKSPGAGETWTKTLKIRVVATDPNGVRRISIYTEKGLIRHFDAAKARAAATYPTTLSGSIDWNDVKGSLGAGPHTISAIALDSTGNPGTASVNVNKTSPPPQGTAAVTTTGDVFYCDKTLTHCVRATPGSIPRGTIIDARKGTIHLVVSNGHGGVYTGDFTGGIFEFDQHRGKHLLITDLTLLGSFTICKARAASASPAAVLPALEDLLGPPARGTRRRVVRYLSAKAHGKFNVIGKRASGIERGTSWKTSDTCNTTEIKVIKGVVTVTDFTKHKHKRNIRAGHTYIAHGPINSRR